MEQKNQVVPFDFRGTSVRTINQDGEPWFIAKDVCSVLGFSRPEDPLRMVGEDDKYLISNKAALFAGLDVGPRGVLMVNESGVYQIIFQSNKPETKAFKRWITHEVIPTIRKTGGAYLTAKKTEELLDNPDLIIGLAQQVKELREENRKRRLICRNFDSI